MRYHYTPNRMAKIQKSDNTNCWQGYRATGMLIHWLKEYNQWCSHCLLAWSSHCGRKPGSFLTKVSIVLPYDRSSLDWAFCCKLSNPQNEINQNYNATGLFNPTHDCIVEMILSLAPDILKFIILNYKL